LKIGFEGEQFSLQEITGDDRLGDDLSLRFTQYENEER